MAFEGPGALRRVRISAVRCEGEGILAYDLVPDDGRALERFAPGAHIDVHLPGGLVRQYSLCGDPEADGVYTIAVQKEPQGRGGSVAMHQSATLGTVLAIAGPRNNFPLADNAAHSVFIAGGIGITPIRPMIHALQQARQGWELHYCARSRQRAAFYDSLKSIAPERVTAYFPEGARGRLDVAVLLRDYVPGTHVYCCGPARLMTAVAEAAAHWPAGHVHFEWFSAAGGDAAANEAFEVELQRSGVVLAVPADRSILQVLCAHGYDVPCACREGVCGTCETPVLAGEPEHRDALLSPAERAANKTMMVCVSRSKTKRLVLDL